MATRDRTLSQWAIWSPALMVLMALGAGGALLHTFLAPVWLQLCYLVCAMVLIWWIAPRLGYRIWCDATTLRWRWGMLHHEGERSVALGEIKNIEVVALPDIPRRYVRTVAGVEVHGGNFTPSLNRGVAIKLGDGRTLCFGLPEPERFAAALRAVLPAPLVPDEEAESL